ncbi:TPA: carbon storage regulator [Pseudomonas aeruginosa]|nr:carbon storage regulator [Pseudomonas aeruginosa]
MLILTRRPGETLHIGDNIHCRAFNPRRAPAGPTARTTEDLDM